MNMLKFLITNELAMTYNWKGQNKKSFETTKLREVITGMYNTLFNELNIKVHIIILCYYTNYLSLISKLLHFYFFHDNNFSQNWNTNFFYIKFFQ